MTVRRLPTRPVATRGSTIAFLGDSITAGSTAALNYGDAFPIYAVLASGGRLVSVGYHGQGGETSTGGLARLGTALAKQPSYLHILYGTNDSGQSTTAGLPDLPTVVTFAANITTMCARARAVGTEPILGTIPPNNGTPTSARALLILKLNIWLRRFCMKNGILLIDYYTLLAKDGFAESPAGNYKTIYALDGTHPNGAGAGAMGGLLWNTLKVMNYGYQAPLLTAAVDTSQVVYLMRNSLWASSTGAPGVRADFCTNLGTADANSVYSLVTNSLIPGNLQRVAMNSSATVLSLGINTVAQSSVNAAVGDVISFAGQFISDGGLGLQAQIVVGATTYKAMSISRGTAFPLGGYQMEFASPVAGQIQVNLIASGSSGVAGQVDLGFPSVINLTSSIGETVPLNAN